MKKLRLTEPHLMKLASQHPDEDRLIVHPEIFDSLGLDRDRRLSQYVGQVVTERRYFVALETKTRLDASRGIEPSTFDYEIRAAHTVAAVNAIKATRRALFELWTASFPDIPLSLNVMESLERWNDEVGTKRLDKWMLAAKARAHPSPTYPDLERATLAYIGGCAKHWRSQQ